MALRTSSLPRNEKERLENDESFSDILLDPLGPSASLAFMEPLSKASGVVRGAPSRGITGMFKNYTDLSNVGTAKPGLTSKALRLGMSPGALRIGSRFLGLPGLALTGGMWAYDKWKDRGKDKDDEFKVRKYTDDED